VTGHVPWQRDVTRVLCNIDHVSTPPHPPILEKKMKKAILLCGVLLAMSATMASAGGVNLRWNNCLGDGGVQNRDFACNTNSAVGVNNNVLIGSFSIDADLALVNGNELVLDISTASPVLPEWWQFFNAGVCRATSLALTAHGTGLNCPDMFEGQASMNIFAYEVGLRGPNTARVKCVDAVAQSAIVTLFGAQEYGIARWAISNQKTVGSPTCAGCAVPACISFNNALITTNGDLNNTTVNAPSAPGSNFVTWQGGAGSNCPAATPTRNATWGSVKSLYR